MLRYDVDWKTVGQRLRLTRKEHGLSQREFGRELGVSQNMICHYEKGRSRASVAFYLRAAEFGNRSIEWLLTGRGDHVTATLREMCDLHEKMKGHLEVVRRLLDQETAEASEQEILAINDPIQLRETLLDKTDLPQCLRDILNHPIRWSQMAMNGREFYTLDTLVRVFGQMSPKGLELFLQLVRSEMGKTVGDDSSFAHGMERPSDSDDRQEFHPEVS